MADNSNYGFKHNLHQKPSETIVRVEWLEKHVNSTYSVTAKRLIVSAIVVAVVVLGSIVYLVSDTIKLKFIFVPTLLMIIGFLILISQYMFIDPSSGSLISGSIRLFKSVVNSARVSMGKKKPFRGTEILKVKQDGTIVYRDGSVALMFNLDGATSLTAFPEEVMAQESKSIQYQNTRDRSLAEIKITSSQPQNTERQTRNMKIQKRNARSNKAVFDIIDQQERFVSEYIDGVKTTVIQYLILKSQSKMVLDEGVERLENCTSRGLYYSVTQLSAKQTKEILSDIYALK
ncbi:TPA: hypothetical protein NOC22_002149 [Enterococcus faecium]|nr:hypothetical protein [Enterococcus faecium]HCI0430855.1 hypothetical protein [Enterococcus faecium]HCI1301536.1 hypothetical protein [Enterococcus faecium]